MRSRRFTLRRMPLLLAALMLAFLAAGCATKSPAPPPVPEQRVKPRPASDKAARIIRMARSFIGYPYTWGGDRPETGFDCSGLIWFVYRRNGIPLPRVSWQQFGAGSPVKQQEVRPGDLVFYQVNKSGKSLHAGIVTERGTFVHAPSSGKRVMESSLTQPYWIEHYIGTRRVF